MEGFQAGEEGFLLHFGRNYLASSVDDGWGWSQWSLRNGKEQEMMWLRPMVMTMGMEKGDVQERQGCQAWVVNRASWVK